MQFLKLTVCLTSNQINLSSSQLLIEASVGIAVIVRVFVNKKDMETEIVNRLGNGFSRAPFATVVVSFLSVKQCLMPLLWMVMVLSYNVCRVSALLFPFWRCFHWVNFSFSTCSSLKR